MTKKILIGLGCIILLIVGIGAYVVYQFDNFFNDLNECGLSAGPCFGQKQDLNISSVKVDQYLSCPNGQIGFISTQDTLSPIIFKVDKDNKLLWAFELNTDSCIGVPLKKMNGMTLEKNGAKSIRFNNQSYGEPGTIYLTDEYDFMYLCLSPM